MEYINEITINEAVIHALDSNAGEPILNEYPLRLNDETYMFIHKITAKSLKDEKLKYAKFNNDSVIKDLASDYINGHKELIEISQEIAKDIFSIMKHKCNIPSADLLVVSISTEYGPIIAIFKLDYAKNYHHNIEFVDNKLGMNIIPVTSLPKTVKQCAFIKGMKLNGSYDLMVLDKTKDTKEEEYSSNWFKEKFLECYEVENERDITKKFLNATDKWIKSGLKENADAAEIIRNSINKKLIEEDKINIPKLADEILGQGKDIRENFVEYMNECNVDEKFSVDKQWVEAKLKKKKLKIDKDIELSITQEAYKDTNRFEIIRNGDGSIDMLIKNIRNYIEK
ncbi:MAG: nucleoid-associated protein [Bacillota bacterium]|nr:nucleoid-associated protein [Bacillota bacterium]